MESDYTFLCNSYLSLWRWSREYVIDSPHLGENNGQTEGVTDGEEPHT